MTIRGRDHNQMPIATTPTSTCKCQCRICMRSIRDKLHTSNSSEHSQPTTSTRDNKRPLITNNAQFAPILLVYLTITHSHTTRLWSISARLTLSASNTSEEIANWKLFQSFNSKVYKRLKCRTLLTKSQGLFKYNSKYNIHSRKIRCFLWLISF